MKQSDQINELATALSKAQSELEDASKDAINPFFNNKKYASLSSALKEIRPVFSKYGLALIQAPWTNGDAFTLTTLITHASGQWISADLGLILDKSSMQSMGSAISYARRYMALGMSGIGTEDDDGNVASQAKIELGPNNTAYIIKTTPPPKQAPQLAVKLKALGSAVTSAGWTSEQAKNFMKAQFGIDKSENLSDKQYSDFMAHLTKKRSHVDEIYELGPEQADVPY